MIQHNVKCFIWKSWFHEYLWLIDVQIISWKIITWNTYINSSRFTMQRKVHTFRTVWKAGRRCNFRRAWKARFVRWAHILRFLMRSPHGKSFSLLDVFLGLNSQESTFIKFSYESRRFVECLIYFCFHIPSILSSFWNLGYPFLYLKK